MARFTKAIPILIAALCFSLGAYADNTRDSSSSGGSAASGSSKAPEGGVSKDLEKEFKALDRDGDGKLDMSEFQSMEANASPDRSLGSVPAEAIGHGPAAGGTSQR